MGGQISVADFGQFSLGVYRSELDKKKIQGFKEREKMELCLLVAFWKH